MDTKKLFYEVVKVLQSLNGNEHGVEILEDGASPLLAMAMFGNVVQLEDKVMVGIELGLGLQLTAELAWALRNYKEHVLFQSIDEYFCSECDEVHEGPDALMRYAKDLMEQAEEMEKESSLTLN